MVIIETKAMMKMLMFVLTATQNYSSLPLHPTGRPTGRFKALLSEDVGFPGNFYGDSIPRTHTTPYLK